MDSERLLSALAGGQLTIGTIVLAVAGGPIWAVGLFGSLAGLGIFATVNGE